MAERSGAEVIMAEQTGVEAIMEDRTGAETMMAEQRRQTGVEAMMAEWTGAKRSGSDDGGVGKERTAKQRMIAESERMMSRSREE
ncbi:hypothetical protein Sjap_024045 [Stephania japonica]|uniref:Uncharacterized protein n=1 Tax=Stephania japonica TaxID=461633 RepID=A0AAP0HJI4_9MAGN